MIKFLSAYVDGMMTDLPIFAAGYFAAKERLVATGVALFLALVGKMVVEALEESRKRRENANDRSAIHRS